MPSLLKLKREMKLMDIFDVLTAISKRKMAFMHTDMNGNDALIKADSRYLKIITYRCLISKSCWE